MLLAGGGMNHLLILVSRYIFMPNADYGMSSRYALQYQIGILGILLTFALAAQKQRKRTGADGPALAAAVTAVFLAGNLITTAEEFSYGIHRKNYNMGNRISF